MTLKYFLIGLISISIFFAIASTWSPAAFAQNLTIFSLFVNGGISGTEHILEGTNAELTNQYYKVGDEFDKKTGIKPGDPVTFVFNNNSAVNIPYPGKYKNVVAEDFLREVITLGD
jgi:hypothetical protein